MPSPWEQRGDDMDTAIDTQRVARFKESLMEEKERIILNSRRSLSTELSISSDDLPDETDLAATEVNQNLVFKLRDRERHLLTKIDQALSRIENGTFGTCRSCEEPIEVKRLQARPVSELCLSCKEREEHREKVYA